MNTTLPCYCPAAAENETIKDFSFILSDTIDKVSELQWNKHVPEPNKLMQYDELKLIEGTQQGKMQFRYVFVKKQDITVGVIYFQIVRFTGNDLLNYFPDEPAGTFNKYAYKMARGLSEPLIKTVDLKLLVSGNIFMTGENGFYFNTTLIKANTQLNDLEGSDWRKQNRLNDFALPFFNSTRDLNFTLAREERYASHFA